MKLSKHAEFSLKGEIFSVYPKFVLYASVGMKSNAHLHLLLTTGLEDELLSDGFHSCQIRRQLQPRRARLQVSLTRLLDPLDLPCSEQGFLLRTTALRSAAG